MTEIALVLALVTLAAGIALAFALRLLPTVRLQLVGLALLAVVLPLGGVLASGWVMFHMHDDAKILAVSSAAALSAIVGALLLARWIVKPLESLRSASAQLAGGDLGVRASEQGPEELAEVGADFNSMAESIERLFAARRELVAWASHDLRTPLASMRAMLEAIDDGLAQPDEYLPALRDVRALLARRDLTNLRRLRPRPRNRARPRRSPRVDASGQSPDQAEAPAWHSPCPWPQPRTRAMSAMTPSALLRRSRGLLALLSALCVFAVG